MRGEWDNRGTNQKGRNSLSCLDSHLTLVSTNNWPNVCLTSISWVSDCDCEFHIHGLCIFTRSSQVSLIFWALLWNPNCSLECNSWAAVNLKDSWFLFFNAWIPMLFLCSLVSLNYFYQGPLLFKACSLLYIHVNEAFALSATYLILVCS